MEKHFDDETEPPAAQRSATEVIGEFVRVALFVFSIVACCVVLLGKTFLPEDSVLLYILSGSWQRGFNVFAATSSLLSACAVLIAVGIILAKCGVNTTALLTGVGITLNQDTRNETWASGGVRISLGATINLRGMPHIAGNARTNGEPSNLMLDEAINITGPILEGAEVGITANPGTYFTEYRSWDNYNPSKDPGTVFTPDDQLQMVKLTLMTEGGTVNASGFTQQNGAYTASITPGESIELPAPERSGYYFRGWYTEQTDGEGALTAVSRASAVYAAGSGDAAKSAADIKIVTFYGFGGVVVGHQTFGGADKARTPAEISIPGYAFDGW